MADTLNGGWIPYSDRTTYQKRISNKFLDRVGTFKDRNTFLGDLPDKVITPVLELELEGKLHPRVKQLTGSCVGSAAANGYLQAMVGDKYFRKDNETVKLPFPFCTYGVGREIARLGGPGDGSFGSAQADACKPTVFGILPFDHPSVPKPTINDGWAYWTETIETNWSWPAQWKQKCGVSRAELEKDSKPYGLHTVTQAKTVEEVLQALAQGYGVTIASMFGTNAKVEGDVCIGRWNTSWAHQMTLFSYWRHPQHGLIIGDQNQWGTNAHPLCPTLSKIGVTGAFWILEKDLEKNIKNRDTEVFIHSATGGFDPQAIDWSNFDMDQVDIPWVDDDVE